jgi:hypothetical protein
MTPGERRRRDRKYNREEYAQPVYLEAKQHAEHFKQQPHPKISGLTAWDYIEWCYWNGHSNPIKQQLESL